MLGAVVHNLVFMVTWRPGFVYPCLGGRRRMECGGFVWAQRFTQERR